MWNESHEITMKCDQCGTEIKQNKMEIRFGGGPFGNGWYTVDKTLSGFIPISSHSEKEISTWHFCSIGCLSNWAVDKA